MFKRSRLYIAYKIKLLSLKIVPLYIARKFLRKKGKFLFIDCGSNLGQGFTHFKKYFTMDRFDYVLIEPNPNCTKILKKKYGNDVEIIEKGVWVSESKLDLFGLKETGDKFSPGSSLISNHNSSFYEVQSDSSLKVDTISLTGLLKEKKKKYDVIIVKMDIESSEYTVLPEIIKDDSISLIDHIFIEFHSEFFDSNEKLKYLELENEIIKKIRQKKIGLTKWI